MQKSLKLQWVAAIALVVTIIPLMFSYSRMIDKPDANGARAIGDEVAIMSSDKVSLISFDNKKIQCSEPVPDKKTVDDGLSFIQTRTCKVNVADMYNNCMTIDGDLSCINDTVSLELYNHGVGSKTASSK